MTFHPLDGHPVQRKGLRLNGKWNAYEECAEVQVMTHAIPTSPGNQVNSHVEGVFIGLAG